MSNNSNIVFPPAARRAQAERGYEKRIAAMGWFRAALARRSSPDASATNVPAAITGPLAQHLSAGQPAINRGDIAGAIHELRGDGNVALPAQKNNLAAFAELQRGFDLLNERNFTEAAVACLNYQGLIDYEALDRTDNRAEANPKISVVIVAYKINNGLIQCLDSLTAGPNPPHEIIVVDNGGNEAIHTELARRPILHVRVGFNVILAEGRNMGVRFAGAPIAAFIDDDALAGPHYLESILEAFNTLNIHALRGRVLPKTDHPNNRDVKHYDLGALPLPCFNNTEGNSATRVDTWRQFGGQDPLLFGAEGLELSYRMSQQLGDTTTIYWPWTTIQHDYAVTDAKKEAKKSRHELMREYAEWKHAGLAEAYRQVRRNYDSEADRTRLATELAAGAGAELPALLARLERRFQSQAGADYFCMVERPVQPALPADEPAAGLPPRWVVP